MADAPTSKWVWGFPANSRKAHAFDRYDAGQLIAKSACGRYGYLNMKPDRMDPETGDSSPDNCTECWKKVRGITTAKLSAAQRRVWDRLPADMYIMVWPALHLSSGCWRVGPEWGDYDATLYAKLTEGGTVSLPLIVAMVAKGCLLEVDRKDADATSSGKDAAVRYQKNPNFTPK
jgi:hypothetical protein